MAHAWCDSCGSRIDPAVEEGERLTDQLLCQRCMNDACDVLCEVNDAERKRCSNSGPSNERPKGTSK